MILFLVPLGALLGPLALGVLSERVLAYLEPAMPVALATWGLHIGLKARPTLSSEPSPSVRAHLASAITILVAGVGMFFAARALDSLSAQNGWLIAAALGVCAAMSASSRNLVPLALGALVSALLRDRLVAGGLGQVGQAMVVFLIIALAGWLLMAKVTSDREQRIFLFGTVLLAGGAAEYLSLPALLAGLIVGLCWSFAGDVFCEPIARDVQHVLRPMIVLSLVVAGALADVTMNVLLLAVAYIVLRLIGRLIERSVAARDARRPVVDLLAPGSVAIAFALSALRVTAPDAFALLSIVVLGTFATDLLWLTLRPRAVVE